MHFYRHLLLPSSTTCVLSVAPLQREVSAAIELGYRTVKIKVGGRDAVADARRVEAALAVLPPGCALAVDANGKVASAIADSWMSRMAGYGLAWIEEPAPPLDYAALASLSAGCPVPIGTGENLFSLDDARNLLRYGAMRATRDRVQIDPLLSYGIPEYRRILTVFEAAGWARSAFWPHAGHLFAAHLVAGLALGSHEAAPDGKLVYGGFWDDVAVREGQVTVPEAPGVGYESKQNMNAILRALADSPAVSATR